MWHNKNVSRTCEVIKMKSNLGAYIAGGMSVLGIWLVYENRQRIESMMKNITAKADMMLQEMKNCSCNNKEQEC
jgi:hypothetical protein